MVMVVMVVMILKMLIVIIFIMFLMMFLMMTKHRLGWCSKKIWLSNQAVDVLLGRAVRCSASSDRLYSLSDITGWSAKLSSNISKRCLLKHTLWVYFWVVHILLLSLFIVFSLSLLQYCINSLKVTWSWKPVTNHFVLAMVLVRAIACLFPSCSRNFKVASLIFPGFFFVPFRGSQTARLHIYYPATPARLQWDHAPQSQRHQDVFWHSSAHILGLAHKGGPDLLNLAEVRSIGEDHCNQSLKLICIIPQYMLFFVGGRKFIVYRCSTDFGTVSCCGGMEHRFQ